MDEDDECNALRQLLKERFPGGNFRDSDIKVLVDAGYATERALAVADKKSLGDILPTRPGIVNQLVDEFFRPPAGEIEDRSEDWITHMLLPQLPDLPQNKAGLEKVLFPEQHGKLPVPKETYKYVSGGRRQLAAKFLIETDASILPLFVGVFLLRHLPKIVTEIQTSSLVGFGGLQEFFGLFNQYVNGFNFTLLFNSTEKAWHSFSQTTAPMKRPDTIGTDSECTFLVGEERVDNLLAAEVDLCSKMRPLNPLRMLLFSIRSPPLYTEGEIE